MRLLLLALGMLLASGAWATGPTFALLAAMGTRFEQTHEVYSTGTHLAPYRRTYDVAQNDIINKLVLRSLDDAVAGLEPESKRLYFAVRLTEKEDNASVRAEAAIAKAIAVLRDMPERTQWDRIIVATPAHSPMGRNGLANRIQGLGVFLQPLCQSTAKDCELGFNGRAGPETEAPDGSSSRANFYVAPYSYIEIWILDPKTLAVLDRQQTFQDRKLFDRNATSLDMGGIVSKEFMAETLVKVLSSSVQDAVRATELRGKVEVHDVGPVEPR